MLLPFCLTGYGSPQARPRRCRPGWIRRIGASRRQGRSRIRRAALLIRINALQQVDRQNIHHGFLAIFSSRGIIITLYAAVGYLWQKVRDRLGAFVFVALDVFTCTLCLTYERTSHQTAGSELGIYFRLRMYNLDRQVTLSL